MSNFQLQGDLMDFSKTASPDEERLLQLYRNCSLSERNEILYRVTRLKFATCFGDWAQANGCKVGFNDERAQLHEELEDCLRSICPMELLQGLGTALTAQQVNGMWQGAWGSIAPVILGTSEMDGQRADELHRAVRNVATAVWKNKTYRFGQGEALGLIATWREEALQRAFSREDSERT